MDPINSKFPRATRITHSLIAATCTFVTKLLVAGGFLLAIYARADVPVLAYHPRIEAGDSYSSNELIAFQEDLRLINELGYLVIPASWLIEWYLGGRDIPENSLVITFDDGADATLAFLEAIEAFSEEVGEEQPYLHATTFVIASPTARGDIAGGKDMDESWWRNAEASPFMSVENHSWDHNHPSVVTKCDAEGPDDHNFREIDNFSESNCEIPMATLYIKALTGRTPTLLAYPYGQSSDYLREVYLPDFQAEHGLLAAFGTYEGRVSPTSSRWDLPRYVHRWHWKTSDQLRALLVR